MVQCPIRGPRWTRHAYDTQTYMQKDSGGQRTHTLKIKFKVIHIHAHMYTHAYTYTKRQTGIERERLWGGSFELETILSRQRIEHEEESFI